MATAIASSSSYIIFRGRHRAFSSFLCASLSSSSNNDVPPVIVDRSIAPGGRRYRDTRANYSTGRRSGASSSSSSSDLHSMYMEQMAEIRNEREVIFGTNDVVMPEEEDDDCDDSSRPPLESYHPMPPSSISSTSSSSSTSTPPASPSWRIPPHSSRTHADPTTSTEPRTPRFLPPGWNDDDGMGSDAAGEEREGITYGFTDEEREAWKSEIARRSRGTTTTSSSSSSYGPRGPPASSSSSSPGPTFSHLNARGDAANMVDVGNKLSSRRIARARTYVIFPTEVMSALRVVGGGGMAANDNIDGMYDVDDRDYDRGGEEGRVMEMIGPKGPIFETAKIAGIMGAKKTSDLIPLCHPLPLDVVNVDIRLVNNVAIIECECRVTHTTGVEMEALTGASVAALTIYDMVKAVSHDVEIGRTYLISKSGGKSDFVRNSKK